jgi:MinD-like ATPase involved in chromosome partitioning or flagellar assembly
VSDRTCVLVLAAGAGWESRALSALSADPAVVVLKRCMDVTDLLATSTAGQAEVAVVALQAPGLDAPAVDHLTRQRVRVVGIVDPASAEEGRTRAAMIGVDAVLAADQLDRLRDTVASAAATPRSELPAAEPAAPGAEGQAVAVWGPTGAPGRTTLTLGIAAELARRGADPLVLDVDPWGGAVAQHLGVLDEVSGLLAAARAGGDLEHRFVGLQRRVAGLRVLTGLPRPDRWVEVRGGVVDRLTELGRGQGPVVLDTGFCLEEDPAADFGGRPGRNAMTLEAVTAADTVLVVGGADPVGLSRLARGLVELGEVTDGRAVHVVVNRVRSRLGWSESDIASMVSGFGQVVGLHFLPYDRDTADRALLTGQTLAELGDSALAGALARLVDGVCPAPRSSAPSRARRPWSTRAVPG